MKTFQINLEGRGICTAYFRTGYNKFDFAFIDDSTGATFEPTNFEFNIIWESFCDRF